MNLAKIYEAYIACLNARELNRLDEYVDDSVIYNSSKIGLSGYREMLAGDYRDIPDLRVLAIPAATCRTRRIATTAHMPKRSK